MFKKIINNISKKKIYQSSFFFTEKNDYINTIINISYLFKLILNIILKFIIYIDVFFKKKFFYSNKDLMLRFNSIDNKKTCFIIGCGPSLKNMNLDFLKNEDLFVTSHFYEHSFCNNYSPKYYFFLDPNIFLLNKKNYRRDSLIINRLKKIKSRTPDSTYVLPLQSGKIIINNEILPIEKTKFVRMLSFDMADYIPKNLDLKSGTPFSFNVLPWMINIALLMKYKKIILIACEQDLYISNYSSFKSKKSIINEMNINGQNVNNKNYNETLYPNTSNYVCFWLSKNILRAHLNLLNFSKIKSAKIINCTKRGVLDVYAKGNVRDYL